MDTSIKGIPTLKDGVWLTNEAYNLGTVPEGFEQVLPPLNDTLTGCQAKFLKKDSTVYVLVAGTNEDMGHDIAYNWASKGTTHFNILEPELKKAMGIAHDKKCNLVIVGDSGGGMVAEYAHLKYGIDAFCTNTSDCADIDTAKAYREAWGHSEGKMVTVVSDGEPLSAGIGYPSYGEVYVIPSKAGAAVRYQMEELGHGKKFAVSSVFGESVNAHVDKQYMINYLNQGNKAYKPSEINYDTYVWKYPNLLPANNYSKNPDIHRVTDPSRGIDMLCGHFGATMRKSDLAGTLGIPEKAVVVGSEHGSFMIDLKRYPNVSVDSAKAWFAVKQDKNFIGGPDLNVAENQTKVAFDAQTKEKQLEHQHAKPSEVSQSQPEAQQTQVKGLEIRQVPQSKIHEIDRELEPLAQKRDTLNREPMDINEAKLRAASDYLKGEDQKLIAENKQIQADKQNLDKREKEVLKHGQETGLDKTLWRHAPGIFKGQDLKAYESEKLNIEQQRNALDKRENEIKTQIQSMNEQLKTPQAEEYIRNQAEQHLKQDQERQKELEKVDTRMKELSEQKQQLQEFNKNIPAKMIDKLYTIEGDSKDLANLLKQADSIQMQSAQHMQQQQSLRTSVSAARGMA